MAEKKGGKKSIKSVLMIALIPLIIIVVIASAFFAIIDGIIGIITGVVTAIANLFNGDWWAQQWENIKAGVAESGNNWAEFWGLDSFNPEEYNEFANKPVYIISQEEFEKIIIGIGNAVDKEATKLDNITIKKMLLAYYKTTMLSSTEIKIAITDDDVEEGKKIKDYSDDDEYFKPFKKEEEKDKNGKSTGKYYLKTNGTISIVANIVYIDKDGKEAIEEDKKLECFTEEGIATIYNEEYSKKIEDEYSYAQGVKRALKSIYALDEKPGCIKMINIDSTETKVEYLYEDANIKSKWKSTTDNQYNWLTIDYMNCVSQYATPMEFLINLMQVAGSKDFIEDVIKLVDSNTSIKLKIYATEKRTEEETTKVYTQKTDVKGESSGFEVRKRDGTIVPHTVEKIENSDKVNIKVKTNEDCDVILYRNGVKDTKENKTEFNMTQEYEVWVMLRESNDWSNVWDNEENIEAQSKTKSDEGTVKYTKTETKIENGYKVLPLEVNNWYTQVTFEGTDIITEPPNLYKIDANKNQVQIEKESEATEENVADESKEYNKSVDEEKKYFVDKDNYTKETENGQIGFINSTYNYIIRKSEDDYTYSDYDFKTININKTGIKQKTLIKETITSIKPGAESGSDKTKAFVDLLKKEYKDNYNSKVVPGELLVNGSEMIFQLLDSSYESSTGQAVCNTVGLSNVMRWILHQYNGEDYGITEFKFELFDMQGISSNSIVFGDTIESKVWYSLRRMGFSEYAVAGVMGNIYAESGFNPATIENGTGIGFGLCQWSYGRRTQLESYAAAKGVQASDINTQIEFLMGEVSKGGGANGYAKYALMTTSPEGSGKTYRPEDWENAKNVEEATEVFCFTFERPNFEKAHLDVRKTKANEYYNAFKGKTINDEVNELQLRIADIAQNDKTIPTTGGYCLKWVNDVYEKAGVSVERKDCAFCSGYNFGVSKDFSIIPIGAAVYGEGSGSDGYLYGHVGIYIGDGKVADNVGHVRITSLESWIKSFPDGCWGWTSSTPVNPRYPVTKGLIHAGRHN